MDAEELLKVLLQRQGEEGALARSVFGDPIEKGETTIVPLARVSLRIGATEGREGGSVVVEPIGYLAIREEEAEFVPIVAPNSPAGILSLIPRLATVWERLRRR